MVSAAERKKQQKRRRERAQAGLKASSFESQELFLEIFVLQGIGLLSGWAWLGGMMSAYCLRAPWAR